MAEGLGTDSQAGVGSKKLEPQRLKDGELEGEDIIFCTVESVTVPRSGAITQQAVPYQQPLHTWAHDSISFAAKPDNNRGKWPIINKILSKQILSHENQDENIPPVHSGFLHSILS